MILIIACSREGHDLWESTGPDDHFKKGICEKDIHPLYFWIPANVLNNMQIHS